MRYTRAIGFGVIAFAALTYGFYLKDPFLAIFCLLAMTLIFGLAAWTYIERALQTCDFRGFALLVGAVVLYGIVFELLIFATPPAGVFSGSWWRAWVLLLAFGLIAKALDAAPGAFRGEDWLPVFVRWDWRFEVATCPLVLAAFLQLLVNTNVDLITGLNRLIIAGYEVGVWLALYGYFRGVSEALYGVLALVYPYIYSASFLAILVAVVITVRKPLTARRFS